MRTIHRLIFLSKQYNTLKQDLHLVTNQECTSTWNQTIMRTTRSTQAPRRGTYTYVYMQYIYTYVYIYTIYIYTIIIYIIYTIYICIYTYVYVYIQIYIYTSI